MKHYTLLALLCWSIILCAQQSPSPYEAGYYRSPVDHTIKVSGTFGELRSDHFHMGLDIKSARGVEGDALYAVADGFVSRIRVSSSGYGNSLYIDHPNGTRSVYAHLSSFAPALARFVDSMHYATQSFELDIRDQLSLKPFTIKQGEQIGTMGNTGSSFGAHLHFELRFANDDTAFNPLLYDFPISDGKAPQIQGLSVYTRTSNGATQVVTRSKVKQVSDQYTLAQTVHVAPGEVGFGIKAYDRQEGTSNSNGVYSIEGRCDGQVHWRATYDTVSFEQTRYIQAHYDYAAKQQNNGYFYRLHKLPGDRLSLYEAMPNDGFINIGFGESRNISIQVSDPFGNVSQLDFTIIADAPIALYTPESYNYLLRQGEALTVQLADATLELPADAVYTDTYLSANVSLDRGAGTYSRCYNVGDVNEPIHASAKLSIPLSEVPMDLRPNAYVSRCGDPDKALTGDLSMGSTHLEIEVKEWGDFELRLDTDAPSIRKIDNYTFIISDKVSRTKYLKYKAAQNGKWLLATLDAKSGRLSIDRSRLTSGVIQLEVWDLAGNTSRYPK